MSTRLSLVLSLVLLAGTSALAQDVRGTIQGRVTDSTNAVVPGVTVRATHVATNQTRTTATNSTGNYAFPLLATGTYQITAECQGFKRFSREGLELRINDNLELNISLEVGGMTDTVTVTAETPLLATADASLGQVVDTRRVAELPVPFGSAYFMMRLGAGVVNGGSNQARQQPWEPGATVDVNMAGSGSKTASITLDGADNTSRDTGGGVLVPGFVPPTDAVAEFKVQTVTFDGTTGGTSGGTMNVSLKSGTNNLHGTAYYSGVPQVWTANTFFGNKAGKERPDAMTKRWGGSVNGPVYVPKLYNGKDHTFFMYAFEGIHYSSPQPATGNHATAAERNGDFSALLAINSNYQIYDPFTRRSIGNNRYQEDPIPQNIISPSRISPIAKKLINEKDYPLPNATPTTADGANNWFLNASQAVKFWSNTFRTDHNFSDKTRMFLRLNNSDANFQLPHWSGPESIYTGDIFGYKMAGFGWDLVHSFTPTLLMNVRLSDARYIRLSASSPEGRGIDLTQKYGFPASYNNLFNPAERRPPTVTISDYKEGGGNQATLSGTYDSLLWYPQESRVAAVSFDKIAGAHTFKFGFEYRQNRQGRYSYGGADLGGAFSFDSTYTKGPLDNASASPRGQGFAAFLLDVPSSGSYQKSDSFYEMSTFYGMYFQDDVKVTRKLTLNLSLRYELEGPLTERFNRSVRNFDGSLTHSGTFDSVVAARYAASPIDERPASKWSTLGGPRYAGTGGVSRELFVRDTNNLMPRIGFAYSVGPKTVLRGGYGVYFGPLGMKRLDVNQLNYNRVTNLISTNDNGLHFIASMANPYPDGVLPSVGNGQGADTYLGQNIGALFSEEPRASRIQKWQFSLQRQLPGSFVVDIGYVGSHGDNLATTRNLQYIPSQYLSRLSSRDQQVINYWTGNVSNPFSGLLPGTNLNASTIAREALMRQYPQYYNGISSTTNVSGSTERPMKARTCIMH